MKLKKLYGLEPATFGPQKKWQVDQDYLNKLQPPELLFMAKFNDEYYGAKVKKGDTNALHNTDELRRACYNRSDCSRRDLYQSCDSCISAEDDDMTDSLDIDPAAIYDGANRTNKPKAKPQPPQPVKKYTPEQLEEFAHQRGLTISKNKGSK